MSQEPETPRNRCRIVLISPGGDDWARDAALVGQAIGGGDIASLILWPGGLDEKGFQKFCEAVVPAAQEAGIAAIVAGDSRIAGRVGADGIHSDDRRELEALCSANDGRRIIGAGGAKTRHDALEVGEMRPDYIFFGRFGYDNRPEPHPRNLSLGEWWAEFVELPCVVMAGSNIASVEAVARTGAEFVALSSAVFTGTLAPGDAIGEANRLLDETAPQLGEPA